MAVYGRPVLYARDIKWANYCENIREYHQESEKHPNWAAWTSQNPGKAAALNEVLETKDDD